MVDLIIIDKLNIVTENLAKGNVPVGSKDFNDMSIKFYLFIVMGFPFTNERKKTDS